jgi:septum formation inhibitor MinC
MANRLKQITTKAKALYKTGRYAKWTDAIKAASKQTAGKTVKKSKIGAAGDYAKFEIATIKSLAKLLKKSLSYTQQFVNNNQSILNIISNSFDEKLTPLQTAKLIKQELTPAKKEDKLKAFVDILSKGSKKASGKNFPMKLPATVTIGSMKKKAATKKKSAAKSYHKDTKSHNVRISVMSGSSQKATLMHLLKEKEITENKLPTIKMLLKQETDAVRKKHYKFWANRYTKYLTGLKKQISEAKKHI